ncbi:hypothetical protein ARNL5_02383 [Anaerolineae bacterium]|nr:hypothetical protein ARNL5_02383 [Anaerolineae bacterium]
MSEVFAVLFIVALLGGISWAAIVLFNRPARSTSEPIHDLPIVRIADAAEGKEVAIVGTAEVIEPLTAPLSGRPCALWHVLVIQHTGDGDRTLVEEHGGKDFLVRDESGVALVRVERALRVFDYDVAHRSGFRKDATPELEAFLAERGHSPRWGFLNKEIYYVEGVIEAGESVGVIGLGRWERPASEGYRDQKGRLIVEAPPGGQVVIGDAVQRPGPAGDSEPE